MQHSIRRYLALGGAFKLSSLSILAAVAISACGGGGGADTSKVTTSGAVPPQISVQPQNASVSAGKTATFSVTATGTAPLSYQWTMNSTNVSGATSASYTTPATTAGDSGEVFAVTITNAAGSMTSNTATLTVTSSSNPVAATPTFSVPAGTYSAAQSVKLSCSTASSTIYYTTNGTTPTHSSSVYSAALAVSTSETIEAICTATGDTDSAVASAAYTIGSTTPVAAAPVFSIPTGVYASAQSVTLSCSTAANTIYYTLNGTTPTSSSSVYSAAISVPSTETIEAICTAAGHTNSAVVSATYTINTSGVYALPANRVTTWKPGVTYNGGIPNRTTIYKTLSPLGSGQDDTPQINAALAACPANEVVALTTGVFLINGNGIVFSTSNCTLRGAGPGSQKNTGINGVATSGSAGTYVVDSTATQLIKADRATNPSYQVMVLQPQGEGFGASINLASDAALGATSIALASNPGIQVGEILLIDELTTGDPDVVYGASFTVSPGSTGWFSRTNRSISQLVEVTAVSGNTITLSTPLHSAFLTAYTAQATRYTVPFMQWAGVENLFVWGGMGGDFHGNISVEWCAYCWVKNVEAAWSVGTNVGFYSTFRSELRDSFIHETADPNPGGGGYQTGINVAAADNLFENNIMWYGNKVDVMRASGGGNVIAYNYMDDAFGSTYPESPEAGVNAGHYTTPHMELIEGNYSFAFKGDTYWGNSIYITVYRNWLSGLRAARAPLKGYDYKIGSCDYLYGDYTGRYVVNVQAYSYYHNFVGNVLGMQNQVLLSDPYHSESCYNDVQTEFLEFSLTSAQDSAAQTADAVVMWDFGEYQAGVNTSGNFTFADCSAEGSVVGGNWTFDNCTIDTQLRDGNWDWFTKAQHWYGIGTNTDGTDPAQALPNSLYLTSAPAFFGSNTWPWVDPSTGTTYTLPAMYCFQQNKMPTCMNP